MRTKNKLIIMKASRLAEVVALRRDLEQEEQMLKDYFKALGFDMVETGDVIVSMEDCKREIVDKDSLFVALGKKANKFVKTIEYVKVNVQRKKWETV